MRACALGQAAAAILGAHVIGASAQEIIAARDAMAAMLRQGGPEPQGQFADLGLLAPVRDYPPRHASALVALEAAAEAVRLAGLRTSTADAA